MRKFIFLIFLFISCNNSVSAQQGIIVSKYMIATIGDSLFFENGIQPSAPPITIFYTPSEMKGLAALRRTESIGIQRIEITTEKGYQLLLLKMPDNQELLFDEPLQILPSKVDANRTYRDTVRYALLHNGTKVGNGVLQCEVNVESLISAETLLRNFANCLVISCIFTQKPLSGTVSFYEAKEWYATGAGLVKAFIKTYQKDAAGKTINMKSNAILLQKAFIGGKWLDGREFRMKE